MREKIQVLIPKDAASGTMVSAVANSTAVDSASGSTELAGISAVT